MAQIAYLESSKCGEHSSGAQPQTICPKDGGSLYVRFDLAALKSKFTPDSLRGRPATMWRYHEVLPGDVPVTLGEGFTPMLPSRENSNVYIKDEGLNPTGSFKARGLCAAVTMARQYGLKKLAVPSAGNAASALAAYCAAAGIEAHIFMPKDVPLANLVECLRRNGTARLASQKEAAKDGCCPGCWLRSGGKSLERAQACGRNVAGRADVRCRIARAQALCRLHYS